MNQAIALIRPIIIGIVIVLLASTEKAVGLVPLFSVAIFLLVAVALPMALRCSTVFIFALFLSLVYGNSFTLSLISIGGGVVVLAQGRAILKRETVRLLVATAVSISGFLWTFFAVGIALWVWWLQIVAFVIWLILAVSYFLRNKPHIILGQFLR